MEKKEELLERLVNEFADIQPMKIFLSIHQEQQL